MTQRHTTLSHRAIHLFTVCALCLLWLFPSISSAQKSRPTTVDVGIFLNSVPSVALKERKFQVDFNIWFRWEGNGVEAIDAFSIEDGQIDVKEELTKKKVDGVNYSLYKVLATIHNNFDLAKYPLDDHALHIRIKNPRLGSGEIVYRADTNNSNVSKHVHVPGWDVTHFDVVTSLEKDPFNYGDINGAKAAEAEHAEFAFTTDIRRNGYGNFFKLFSMLFFAGILSFFAFRVRADHLDARLALIVSGIFMAAITASVISSALPESDAFDMAEQLYLCTMIFIFTSCMASLYTFKVFMDGKEERASQLSRWIGMSLPVLYVIVNIVVVALAHNEI
jgi:hypothetical protein